MGWNEGSFAAEAERLIKAIREADREGLRPDDYHLANIEIMLEEIHRSKRLKTAASIRSLVDLDVLLTDAFLIYASHLLGGRINPETIDGEWQANRREADLVLTLQKTLDSNQVEKELKKLVPPQPEYARLRETLARYREISATGGWSTMPEGRKLQLGDRSERVPILRRRLIVSGDLALDKDSGGDLYDEAVALALRRFQQRHGLDADGAIGPVPSKR